MSRPLLLDLFCKAGGAAMGYHMAGFEVVGVDHEPQPNYPFEFHLDDVTTMEIDWDDWDAVHASPPCQAYSVASSLWPDREYPDLVAFTRSRLRELGLFYVIENVPGSPLIDPVILCGSSFALRVRRHRLFETNWPLRGRRCDHQWQERHRPYLIGSYHRGKRQHRSGVIGVFGRGQNLGEGEGHLWRAAMGIDWMTRAELAQAIPPAYTYHIGRQLIRRLR